MPEKIAVIGSGIGGIAIALRLAVKGYEVSVFEKNDTPGGKISEINHQGYRFDTGPSLFTLPQLIDELFSLAGEDPSSNFSYRPLDLVCRYFYDDITLIDALARSEDFAAELQLKAGEDRSAVMSYLAESRKVYEITRPVFLEKSLHEIKNYFTPEAIRGIFQAYRLKPFSTLHQLNRASFRHPNTVKLFDRFATYNGSNPFKTPATLRVISHLEHNNGAYFPDKGMYEIVRALVALGKRLGVKFRYNCPVEKITLEGNKVRGIRLAGEGELAFDHVVSDIDIWYLYRDLLSNRPFPEKWFRYERSTSAMVFYWGMNTLSPMLDLHNILFAGKYEEEFSCLFSRKTMHDDPTVYIFISSKVVKDDAPSGCENWFVMVNAPENVGQDWDKLVHETRKNIEKKIRTLTGVEVARHRVFEQVRDPRDIERMTSSYRGSLYGNSSNSMLAAFRRHPNFSKIKGLYFTGGSVHPGGGIPLSLLSAKIVAEKFPELKAK